MKKVIEISKRIFVFSLILAFPIQAAADVCIVQRTGKPIWASLNCGFNNLPFIGMIMGQSLIEKVESGEELCANHMIGAIPTPCYFFARNAVTCSRMIFPTQRNQEYVAKADLFSTSGDVMGNCKFQ